MVKNIVNYMLLMVVAKAQRKGFRVLLVEVWGPAHELMDKKKLMKIV